VRTQLLKVKTLPIWRKCSHPCIYGEKIQKFNAVVNVRTLPMKVKEKAVRVGSGKVKKSIGLTSLGEGSYREPDGGA
jgi:hypothetical protein